MPSTDIPQILFYYQECAGNYSTTSPKSVALEQPVMRTLT